MSEVQVTYETRAWRYACDVCKQGDMIATSNQLLPTTPPMFPSQCTNCGFTCNLLHKYPKIETVIGSIDHLDLSNSVHEAPRANRKKAKDPQTGDMVELD